MMKTTTVFLFLVVFLNTSGMTQMDSLESIQYFQRIEKDLDSMKTALSSSNSRIQSVFSRTKSMEARLDSLDLAIQSSIRDRDRLSSELDTLEVNTNGRIARMGDQTGQEISSLNQSLSRNSLYWIIAFLGTALLSILAFIFLRKQVTSNRTSFTERLAQTRKDIEAEALQLDEKLLQLLETQMKVSHQESQVPANQGDDTEIDHSLALKVADEIIRIEKNLSHMEEGTRGLKQVSKAVNRIKNNFVANGYEMVDMIGTPFNEGMKVTANFIPNDDLNPGERIITRIIKPQVNYRGIMIQSAQIEVSQGD